jgi:hypothetical protein
VLIAAAPVDRGARAGSDRVRWQTRVGLGLESGLGQDSGVRTHSYSHRHTECRTEYYSNFICFSKFQIIHLT